MPKESQEIERIRIPLIGTALNRGTDKDKDQRFVNGLFWASENPETGKKTFNFVKRPGISLLNQPGAGAAVGRGGYSWRGSLFSVSGTKIYKGTTDLGVTLTTSSGLCHFAETRPGASTQYLGVNDGTSLYLIDTSDGVTVLNNVAITSSSVANPTTITATAHGLTTGNKVVIRNHAGSTPSLNGTTYTVTVTGANTFTIPVNVTVGGTGGTIGVFPTPNTGSLVFIDTYWEVQKSDATIWNCSPDDPTNWPTDGFITAQMFQGSGVGMCRQSNYLLSFQTNSLQAFFDNANASGSPLLNYDPAGRQIGCVSENSISGDEALATWVGGSNTGGYTVWQLEGLTNLQDIGTTHVKLLLNAEGTSITTCRAKYAVVGGKEVYILDLLSQDRTLVYDFDTKIWTEFQVAGAATRWPIIAVVEHNNALVGQHQSNGKWYTISSTVYQDESVNFTVLARFGRVDFDTMQRKFVKGYEIIGDKQSSTTNVTFQYSDDDFVTLSTARTVDMSATRPFLPQGGNFRRRAHQLSYTGANPLRIEALELTYKLGEQ